jgi:triosephosphate isomerase
MKRFLIAGNWKMNTLPNEAAKLASAIVAGMPQDTEVRVAVCPPFVHLDRVGEAVRASTVALGAQNCHDEEKGAFTGEISPVMLAAYDCTYVIVGHSERRTLFGETDDRVNKKLKAVLAHALVPIFCIGETLEEREADKTFDVIKRQLEKGLDGIDIDPERMVIAYEPVWAIGTGKAATAEQAQEVHAFIRSVLAEKTGDSSRDILLLYGGSMTPDNAESLLTQTDVDGGLIGGASLKAEAFLRIIDSAHAIAQ